MKKSGNLDRPLVFLRKTKSRTPRAMLSLAQVVLLCMQNHPELFPSMILPLEQFEADIEALAAAEVKAASRAIGTHSRRDARLFRVVAVLDLARAYVQWKVDNAPDAAALIAAQAGMVTTGMRNRSTPILKARKSKNRVHCFVVTAQVTHARQTHDWQYSIDGGRTWITAPSTAQATTTFGPFTAGLSVLVRHRSFDSTGRSDWSDPIHVIVT